MPRIENWTKNYHQLLKADGEFDLEPKELEDYALAAYMIGKHTECFDILERVHHEYLDQEKTEEAVRCAFWLGLRYMMIGERARGGGWIARGERLLNREPMPDCAEKGLLLIPSALGALSSGKSESAQKLFEKALLIGEQFDDTDLLALARLGLGQAMIQEGEVTKGVKLLDEMMVTVETGEIFPVARGIVYCAAIETCRKIWDLKRAHEWTSALTRWCEAQPDIVPFKGQCMVRRAEIFQLHGEWQKALEETSDACALLVQPPGEPAAGEAYYIKAQLHRLMGSFEEAEDNYHTTAKWGRKPQPGLALLRLAQGQNDAAEISISNTLQETKDKKKRAELLPAYIRIMLAVEKSKEARKAVNELCDIANEFDTPYLYACSSHCQGAVIFDQGNVQLALEHLQKALKSWNKLQLPYETAQTRELKGLVYQKLNDKDNSEGELAAAKWTYEQLSAKPDLQRIERLLNNKRHYETHGLTLRELQVLHRVASGKTNKSIAGELFISERTVDRHVSNIFNKLGVSSRVEATTFAFKHKILDMQY